MFKKKLSYIFLLNAIFLSGCAMVSHVPLNQQNAQSIKTVYVSPEIKKPATMYEFASGAEFGFAFGAVGGAISGLANGQAAMSTQEFAEKNNVDIKKIVYQQWLNQINNKSRFKLSQHPSDAILKSDIAFYGISIPHGFSTDYVPVLTLNATLMRNQQIIWQDSESVRPFTSGMPRYKMEEIRNDPKKLYAMWDKASERVVNKMLDDMNK